MVRRIYMALMITGIEGEGEHAGIHWSGLRAFAGSGHAAWWHVRRDARGARVSTPGVTLPRSHPSGVDCGFTLIEVLIALAIVAIALGAVLRTIGALVSDTERARLGMMASWSADNALSALRISRAWPEPGRRVFACPEGQYTLVCRQVVSALDNPSLREVTIIVYPSATSHAVLAELVTVLQNEASR